jgi:beta-N-acetylhexosaminidase
MKSNTRLFGIIKLCLVVVLIVFSVSLSYFTSGGDGAESTESTVADAGTDETGPVLSDADKSELIYDISSKLMDYGDKLSEETVIDGILSNMTDEEKVGQLFFLCVKGRFDESLLDEYKIGGILLFSDDVKGETRESLAEKVEAFQEKSDIPLLVGIDEEGGTVSRLNTNTTLIDYTFESPRTLYAEGGFDRIEEDTVFKCRLLKSYGINVNFAPVCDISQDAGDYMYLRSLGESADITAEYISRIVDIMNDEGIGGVLKHFPGYGNNGDTHSSIVYDTRSYEQIRDNDLKPFQAGIDEGADCILVSHNIVESIDDSLPASLSTRVHDILRNDMGFEGVAITDDLSMDGVLEFMDNDEAAVQAIIAGNDMIIATYYEDQFAAVLNAVKDGRISGGRLDEAVTRILKWKQQLGLLGMEQ